VATGLCASDSDIDKNNLAKSSALAILKIPQSSITHEW